MLRPFVVVVGIAKMDAGLWGVHGRGLVVVFVVVVAVALGVSVSQVSVFITAPCRQSVAGSAGWRAARHLPQCSLMGGPLSLTFSRQVSEQTRRLILRMCIPVPLL